MNVSPRPFSRRAFVGLAGAAALPFARAVDGGKIVSGQIGVRHSHAAGKMEAMRTLSDLYQVAGVVETDSASRESAGRAPAYSGLPWMSEEELFAVPGLSVVAVETRMEDLEATALRALRAGKHVHFDKPGGEDHAAFKAMRLEAEKAGLTVQMGYMLRYNPAFELLFRAYREGWLGEILEIEASMGKLAPDGQRRELGLLKGGGLFELAGHIVDPVLTLLGKPDRVTAHNRATQAPDDEFLDNQMAVLEYKKALVVIRCNHADPFGGPRRRFLVTGTQGTFEIAPLESGRVKLSLAKAAGGYDKGTHEIQLPITGGRYDGEFADLAKVVRGEKKLPWDAAHDIAVHETLLLASGVPVGG